MKDEKMVDVYLFQKWRIQPYMFHQYGNLLQNVVPSRQNMTRSYNFPAGTGEKLREIFAQNINNKLTVELLEEDSKNDSALETEES